MKIAVFAYSRQGCRTARRIMEALAEDNLQAYTMERFEEPGFQPIQRPAKPFYGSVFRNVDAMIFVGSAGIAVREIAPHLRDKATDPAVIVIDELGKFVISLLSGHIGGANAMALSLAKTLEAIPVVTTATDINKRFSVDAWAAKNGYLIDNLSRAKAVSAAILEGDVPLHCDYLIVTDLPKGVIPGSSGDVGICISVYRKEPFKKTLRLVPQILHLGIGCRKGIEISSIVNAVDGVLREHGIDPRAIKSVASIDLKAGETGLLEFCRQKNLPVTFYSAEELKKVPGEFTPSAFVHSITGVDNVCERSALSGAKELIVRKTASNGVTVAVAAEHLEVRFE